MLVLENPGLRGASSITHTLYAGLQLILPGEVAPSHRHTQSALRFVVEGEGAYTAVDGERVTMHPGDFIDHAVVDVSRPRQSGTAARGLARRSRYPDGRVLRRRVRGASSAGSAAVAKPEGDRAARYGAVLLRSIRTRSLARRLAPYTRSARRSSGCGAGLARVSRLEAPVRESGERRLPMPTIAAFLQLVPAEFDGKPYRSTDGTVYCVVEGRGRSRSAIASSSGDRATFSSCRRGARSRTVRAKTRCCSAFPTGRCNRRSASGANKRRHENRGRPGFCSAFPLSGNDVWEGVSMSFKVGFATFVTGVMLAAPAFSQTAGNTLADEADPHARRLSRGRADRRRRAARERQARAADRRAHRRRQPPGRSGQHRRRDPREVESRRPHAALFLERDRALAGPLLEARLRPAEGPRAGHRDRRGLPDLPRASFAAGEKRRRSSSTTRKRGPASSTTRRPAPARARISPRCSSRSARGSRRSTCRTKAPRRRSSI